MVSILTSLLVNTLAVVISAYLLPGVHVSSFGGAIVVAVVIGILNVILKPVLLILTLPLTLVTFGLFIFVINAVIILLAARIVPGFKVDSFWWALLFSLVVSLIGSFLNSLKN